MSGKSNYLENLILNWIKGSAFASAPSGVYVGLFNGDPTDAGSGGTEVTTTVRVAGRVAVTFGSITTATGANSMPSNADVDFGNAAGDATISHFALFDAASAGNMLYSGPLTGGTQSVSSGTGVKFNSGSLTVSED
jgi:hypothetical protein